MCSAFNYDAERTRKPSSYFKVSCMRCGKLVSNINIQQSTKYSPLCYDCQVALGKEFPDSIPIL